MATKSNFECFICETEDVSAECVTCGEPFCKKCDERFHNNRSHPNRQKHIRKSTMATKSNFECFICETEDVSAECVTCSEPFCKKCDERFHNNPRHPNRQNHIRTVIVSSFAQCNSCASYNVEYFCTNCEEQQLFCATCDHLFHSHQEREGHVRKQFCHLSHLTVNDGIHCCNCHSVCTVECKDCSKSYCSDCDEKYHNYPRLEDHNRKELKRVCSICEELSITVRCDECSRWYCNECDEFRHKKLTSHIRKQIQEKSPKQEIICGLEEQIKELTNSVEEYETVLEQLKIKKESLEKENTALQNHIKTLTKHMSDKEAKLQRYLPQNNEGTWKKYSGGDLPEDGVVAKEGYEWYVCRAEVDGDVMPGWISSSHKVCLVLHNGQRLSKSPCEVLVPNSSFEWIVCRGDEIPPRAVPGGKTKEGKVLYVGRVKEYGYHHVGKVQPYLNGCYNLQPLANGDFTIHPKYEILVWK